MGNILSVHGATPKIADDAFIASTAVIIGDVEIGSGSNVWYHCVLRGDIHEIRVGKNSNIQDGTVVHCDSPGDRADGRPLDGWPTIIGDDVLIGHMAMVHGCVLEDRAFVGLGAIVMSGCTVESDAMLAAGAMLTSGKTVAHRQLWAGRPAKYMRDLSDEALIDMREGVDHYVHNGKAHKGSVKANYG